MKNVAPNETVENPECIAINRTEEGPERSNDHGLDKVMPNANIGI